MKHSEPREKCWVSWERPEGAVGFQRMGLLLDSLGKFMSKLAPEWGLTALGSKDYKENSEMKSAENNMNKSMTSLGILFFTDPSAISSGRHENNFFSDPRKTHTRLPFINTLS